MLKLLLVSMLAVLTACGRPSRTVKIALVAPFEGRLRQIGYDVFPAMRLALREQIRSGGVGDVYVTFIAYNDNGDPAGAERVARNVALDEEVVAVMGHFVASTTLAALNVYTSAGLPVLATLVPADQLPQDPLVFRMGPYGNILDAPPLAGLPAAQKALRSFTELSLGPPPTMRSVVAYDATDVLLAAIRSNVQAQGFPTRSGVAQALRQIDHTGLLGEITFDANGVWANAPRWEPRK